MKNKEKIINLVVLEVTDTRRLAETLKFTRVLARILQIEIESSLLPGGEVKLTSCSALVRFEDHCCCGGWHGWFTSLTIDDKE